MNTQPGRPDPWYVTGFCDGEAAFTYSLNGRNSLNLYFSVRLTEKEESLIVWLKEFFCGGSIYKGKARPPGRFSGKSRPSLYYRVTRQDELAKVIAHFDAFPLKGQKARAYRLWREMYKAKQHLRCQDGARLFGLARTLSSLTTKNSRASLKTEV